MPDVLFEIREQVAHLTLNRPEKLNAFNRTMALELQDQLLACDEDDSVRAVLLTGSGRAFCSGQDLSEFPADRLPDFEKVIVRKNILNGTNYTQELNGSRFFEKMDKKMK